MLMACSYLRYSSDNQTYTSIEYQRSEIARYCEENGLTLVKEYADTECSGTNDDRPRFRQLMHDVENSPEWEVILIYHTSRLARNTLIAEKSIDHCRSHGVKVVFVSQPIYNENSPYSDFCRDVQFAVDSLQSSTTSESTHSAMRVKAAKAKHLGGIPPLGYDLNEDKKLIINTAEAETVRKIFDMYLSGMSYSQMANELNGQGIKTKTGGRFTKNSFYEILTRRKYIGTYVWNKAPGAKSLRGRYHKGDYPSQEQIHVDGGCPAIITPEAFADVQKRLKAGRSGKSHSKSRHNYMLSGMGKLKCSVCGHTMYGTVITSHGRKYTVYSCPNHRLGICPTKDIKTNGLDEYVANIIVKTIMSCMTLEELNDLVFDKDYGLEIVGRMKRLRHQVDNLVDAIALCSSEKLINKLKAREGELNEIQRKIENGEYIYKIDKSNVKLFKKKLLEFIKDSGTYEARKLVYETISEITVDNNGVKAVLEIN